MNNSRRSKKNFLNLYFTPALITMRAELKRKAKKIEIKLMEKKPKQSGDKILKKSFKEQL